MPSHRPFRRALGVAVAAGAVVAACTDDGTATPSTPPPTVTTTTEPVRIDDGVLRIGLLLPESGEGATIGQPLIEAARLAVEQINAAGGVLGQPVELVEGYDEGNSPTTAREAIANLIERDVDAVVGPGSSTVALATLDDLMTAEVLTCSPTATAIGLDDFPGSELLFFRTAPSDSLQAEAIALYAERTGARTAAVTYLDDAYGRQLAAATIAALQSDLALIDPLPFAADAESLTDEALVLSESDVDVVVVIADGEQGTRMLAELGEVAGLFPGGEPPLIIVNDAVREPPSPQPIQALAPAVRSRIVGLSPLAYGREEGEPDGPFATNALDCVNLIALSAVQAGSDAPRLAAAQMIEASTGGVSCRSFAECQDRLNADLDIDYDGPGGVVEIGAEGDPVRARFDLFEFDERGVDVSRPVPMLIPR